MSSKNYQSTPLLVTGKILLIQPPIQDFYETDIRLQPIGLAHLKSAAQKIHPDVKVKILDAHQGHGRRTIKWPSELQYLKPYYELDDRSPFSSFHNYYHFGMAYDEILKVVDDEAPDLVGISSLFTPYHGEAVFLADLIKSKLGRPILMGGSHVSAAPAETLAHSSVDFVITGEGERPFVEFIDWMRSKRKITEVANLGFKTAQGPRFNPPQANFELGDLPHPDFSDLHQMAYQFEGRPLTFLVTSRSCPHRCSFCSVHTTFGSKYRRRSLGHILDEIRLRISQGYRVIDFEDDNLTFFKDEMKELCRELILLNSRGGLQFLAMNGVSYLSLDDELLALMRRAGFSHLNLALVSSDLLVREALKRPHTLEKYIEVVRKATDLGFHVVSYQILGLPFESLESMIQTLAFNATQPVLLGASMFYLTPNSPLAIKLPSLDPHWFFKSRSTAMAIEAGEFTRQDIYTLFITTRIINFLKSMRAKYKRDREDLTQKEQVGLEILKKIWIEKKLHAWVQGEWIENPSFDVNLFFRVVDQIRVQAGRNFQIKGSDSIDNFEELLQSLKNPPSSKSDLQGLGFSHNDKPSPLHESKAPLGD